MTLLLYRQNYSRLRNDATKVCTWSFQITVVEGFDSVKSRRRNCAIHRDISDRRGRGTANMSIALAALDHDPRRIHRGLQGTRGYARDSVRKAGVVQRGSFLFSCFFFFFSFCARFVRPRRVRLRACVVVRKLRCVFTRLMRLVRSSDEWAADRSIDPLSPIG